MRGISCSASFAGLFGRSESGGSQRGQAGSAGLLLALPSHQYHRSSRGGQPELRKCEPITDGYQPFDADKIRRANRFNVWRATNPRHPSAPHGQHEVHFRRGFSGCPRPCGHAGPCRRCNPQRGLLRRLPARLTSTIRADHSAGCSPSWLASSLPSSDPLLTLTG